MDRKNLIILCDNELELDNLLKMILVTVRQQKSYKFQKFYRKYKSERDGRTRILDIPEVGLGA
jgi:hypothetical protein